jgi:hypothetical protein
MASPSSSSRMPPEKALKKPIPMSTPEINHGTGRLIISNTYSQILTAGAQVLMLLDIPAGWVPLRAGEDGK